MILNTKIFSQEDIINILKNNPDYNISISFYPYYLNNNTKKLKYLYGMVDILNTIGDTNNMVSIKLSWFKDSCSNINFNLLEKFIEYSNDKKIKICISAYLRKYRNEEIDIYFKLFNKGYKNVIITLATYHHDVDSKVDLILKNNGTIRLVKGWWNDGTEKNWNKGTENYYRNANKLVETGGFHILATHDFKLLKRLYDKNTKRQMDNLLIAFYYFNKKYVKKQVELFAYKIKLKSFYRVYGNTILDITNFLHSNLIRNSKLILKSIF
jgi:hypothetical protein